MKLVIKNYCGTDIEKQARLNHVLNVIPAEIAALARMGYKITREDGHYVAIAPKIAGRK